LGKLTTDKYAFSLRKMRIETSGIVSWFWFCTKHQFY